MEPSGNGETFSKFSVKFCGAIPAEPPVSQAERRRTAHDANDLGGRQRDHSQAEVRPELQRRDAEQNAVDRGEHQCGEHRGEQVAAVHLRDGEPIGTQQHEAGTGPCS